jgi:hypothetical protein
MHVPEASFQAIQLEILRRAQFGYFRGEAMLDQLQAHPEEWLAAAMGSFTVRRGDLASAYLLARLRGLTRHEVHGLDTLYLLTPDEASAQIWLNNPAFPTRSDVLSPANLSSEILHYEDPS